MNVATFRPASLQAQLAELKREKTMRARVYPHMVASGKLDRNVADYQMRGLDGAIATIESAVVAQLRGEPTRRELIEALRQVDAINDNPSRFNAEINALLEPLLKRLPK